MPWGPLLVPVVHIIDDAGNVLGAVAGPGQHRGGGKDPANALCHKGLAGVSLGIGEEETVYNEKAQRGIHANGHDILDLG